MLLLEENDDTDITSNTNNELPLTPEIITFVPISKFKLKPQRFRDLMTNPNVWAILLSTFIDIKHMTIVPKHNNLTRLQL